MLNMSTDDWVTSHAPIGNLNSSYQTDVEGIWKKTGTENSEDSNGLKMSVSTELAKQTFPSSEIITVLELLPLIFPLERTYR